MELEEAKDELKTYCKVLCGKHLDSRIIAMQTVLKALDNSISKEVIEKELNDIEDMIDKTTRGELQKYTVGELILYRKIYNKLLEVK